MAISLPLIRIILSLAGKYIPLLASQRIHALSHRLTYHSVPTPLNVLVLGGSYAGVQVARRLVETLPTGYRVVLVEKKTHFNHLFNFPRYAVVKDREERAFIPYDGIGNDWAAPAGIFEKVTGEVVRIGQKEVEMRNGEKIPFAFLAVCTGATLPNPGTLHSSTKEDSCAELQDMQARIERAQKIAVVGGGAVGVQISGDIKSFYPEKEVVLVHSRQWLCSGFGRILGDHVKERYESMGIRVLTGERPVLGQKEVDGTERLLFKDGRQENFDLVIPCTGQKPNSSLMAALYPECISPTTSEILVYPTLQIASTSSVPAPFTDLPPPTSNTQHNTTPSTLLSNPAAATSTTSLTAPLPANIFAVGDVALTHGPKMARASFMQTETVIANILTLIASPDTPTSKLQTYTPTPIEGTVSLSLGLDESVSYMKIDNDTEFLWPGKGKGVDLEVKKMWWMMGVKTVFEGRFEAKNGGKGDLVVAKEGERVRVGVSNGVAEA